MSSKLFTEEQIKKLRDNPNVKTVSAKSITYAKSFKETFIKEYYEGKSPTQIFRDAGFEVEVVGVHRIKDCRKRWRKQAKSGEDFTDGRKVGSGRPKSKHLTKDEIIARQKAQIEILKQERDFLLELKRLERRVIKKGK